MMISLINLIPAALAADIPILNPIPTPAAGLKNLSSVISSLITVMFVIAGLATFVQLVLGGFQWITSGGEPKNTEKAGKQITNALIGLGIVALSWALMTVIGTFFHIDIFGGLSLPQPQ